jgi:hypothetical protein
MYPECVLIIALAIAAATPTGAVKAFLAKICADREAEKTPEFRSN